MVQLAASNGQFKTLVNLLVVTGLDKALQSHDEFTVLAPTDEAFKKIPEATLASLLLPENKDTLACILKYHVIAGSFSAKDVIGVANAETLEGSCVNFQFKDGKLTVENGTVLKNDIAASNGVIHVIDTVLMPPSKSVSAKRIPVAAPAKHAPVSAPAKKCPNQTRS